MGLIQTIVHTMQKIQDLFAISVSSWIILILNRWCYKLALI